jgi:hypothetical protein
MKFLWKRRDTRKSRNHAGQRQKYSTWRRSFRVSRLLPLVLIELRPSYCVLTTLQVVEWPELEVLLGQLENLSPCLKNTTTVGCVAHLYGPVVEQVDPEVPVDVTGVCV